VLQSEATVEEFCRIMVILSIEKAIDPLKPASAQATLNYTAIDSACKLIVCLVKVLTTSGGIYISKMGLLTTFFSVVADVLTRDFERDPEQFAQRPFFRIIINLVQDLNANDPELDAISVPILMAFSRLFHDIRPALVPGFCMAWLELISHRTFMPRLLQSKTHNLMQVFKSLLVDLFSFMQVYLRVARLTDSMRLLYKGTLRVLLVLLHDFPEFLCSYHFSFCDVIPPSCVQMRNLVLSAFPRHMRLPDPFLPNLKVSYSRNSAISTFFNGFFGKLL
jgi:CCR4-NOT transcription complex subunit 1